MKVAFATLGCKVNQYDSAVMADAARRAGARVVPFAKGADVYVVNTCTVTDRADADSRRLARRARRLNPEGRVILTGCFAQVSPARAAAWPFVDDVIGIGRLSDVLCAVRGELDRGEGGVRVGDLSGAGRVETFGADSFPGQTRAFLKIQEGCNLCCSFCIVPQARGRSRSVEPRRVLGEMARLAAKGFQEIVLTGTHLGGYGRDSGASGRDLCDLLEMVAEAAPLPRVRLSSLDPPEVTHRLLGIMARSPVFCPHLHVPVQAGADSVLRRMRRRYDAALVRDVVEEIARVFPDAAVGTDIIAGFPGETEGEFEAGRELFADLPFTYFHVFPYSRRHRTSAGRTGPFLPAATVTRRARQLRSLGVAKRRRHAARFIGRRLAVLIEATRDRATGHFVGYSRNYVRVLTAGAGGAVNTEVPVDVEGRLGERLLGRIAHAERENVRRVPT